MAEPELDGGDDESEITEFAEPQEGGPGELARRVQWLFANKRKPDGRKYSQRDVAREGALSPTTVSRVYSGENPNPSMEILAAFARTFDVPFQYFDLTASAEQEERRTRLDQAMKSTGIEAVMMRSMDLTPEGIDLVLSMIDRARALEGLPPMDDSPGKPE